MSIFSNIDDSKKLYASDHFFIIKDQYPVSPGHLLIISKELKNDYFSLNNSQKSELTKLIDVAKQLIEKEHKPNGYNIGMTPIFCKVEKNGKETPWHQDGEYWPIKPLETITVWLAIDEVTQENGPLQYIPGSHMGKKLEEHLQRLRQKI